ncbi:MAG: hypothetical protein M3N54_08820 [Acidobacteriota bacterium]|nr:hypothetical protein [Acidobacteriota bacterium]
MKTPVCLFLIAATLAADPLTDVYARIDKAAGKFTSMAADVKDDDYTSIVQDHDIRQGTIKLKRMKNGTSMLIDFTGKSARSIALAGGVLRVYYPNTKQEQVWDVANKRSLIDEFLLLGFGATSAEIRKSYDVSYVGPESIAGQPATCIRLIPKSAEVLKQVKSADLWISDSAGLPVQQRFSTSASGDYKLVTYSNMKPNPSLSEKDLQLKIPKDVQIQQMGK